MLSLDTLWAFVLQAMARCYFSDVRQETILFRLFLLEKSKASLYWNVASIMNEFQLYLQESEENIRFYVLGDLLAKSQRLWNP